MAKKTHTSVLSICYELWGQKQKKKNQMAGCENATLIIRCYCNNATPITLF